MIYKIAKAVGLNTDQQASLVFSSGSDDLFLAILSLTCDDAFTFGRSLLSDLSDSYFAAESPPAERLQASFSEAKEKLASVEEFDLLLALAKTGEKGVLYLIGEGKVAAKLKRFDNLISLKQDGEGQLISGFLQPGDRVILSTSSFAERLGDELKEVLELPFDSLEEELELRVTSEGLNSEEPEKVQPLELAALVMEIEGEDEVAIPPISSGTETEKQQSRRFKLSLSFPRSLPDVKRFIFPGKTKLILAGILVLIILLGAGIKYKKAKDQDASRVFSQFLQQAKDDYSAASGLHSLDPGGASSKLSSAKDNLNKALNLKPNDSVALDLKKQIEGNSSNIGQKYDNAAFSLFLDLDLVKKGLHSEILSLSDGKILVLDPGTKTLASIDLAKKSQQILAGKDTLGDAEKASINGGSAFVYSKDKGVVRVDLGNQKATVVAKLDKDWGRIVDLYGFGGNVYLLDSAGNQLWKYLPTSDGYSDKRTYLSKDTKTDLGGAKKLQIESSVYVLKSGGDILRFTRGAPDNFSIGGLDKNLKDPKSIFTSSDTDNLYILDSGNSRLVVVTKTGAYKAQYSGDEHSSSSNKFGTASDLVVDEAGKKVYLLEGSKIYIMELK